MHVTCVKLNSKNILHKCVTFDQTWIYNLDPPFFPHHIIFPKIEIDMYLNKWIEIKPHPSVIHLDIWFNLSHLYLHLTHCSFSHTCFSHLSFFFSHSFVSPFLLSLHRTHFILTTFAFLQSWSSGKWSNITNSHNPKMTNNKMHSSMWHGGKALT
jgi:hypothetical protein